MNWYNEAQPHEVCSFCGRAAEEFDLSFIKGYNSNICTDCIIKAFTVIKKTEHEQDNNAYLWF